MSNNDNNHLTRRQMLAGLTGAVAVAGVAASTSIGTLHAAEKTNWDLEADVICVGGGAASLTAAVTAVNAGAKVVVLEKTPVLGGTSAKSGAVFWIPNHYGLKARDIDDDRTSCLQYLCRYAYPNFYNADAPNMGLPSNDFERIAAFYDNGAPMVDLLREVDALRIQEWRLWSLDRNAPDYLSHVPENRVPKGRALTVVNADGEFAYGFGMIEQLETWLTTKGATILTNHPATELVLSDNGAVVGVKANRDGKIINIRAHRGVIFGTGGYAHNVNLINAYQEVFIYGSCSQQSATGDFIEIASRAGARLGNLHGAWRTQVVLDDALQNRAVASVLGGLPSDSMMLVNKYGKRVVNEHRNYNDRTAAHFDFDVSNAEYPNHLLFMVYDKRTADTIGEYGQPVVTAGAPHVIEGKNTEELARGIATRLAGFAEHTGNFRLDDSFVEGLNETITRFNEFARTGKDLDFNRGGYDYDREWNATWSKFKEGSGHEPNPYPNSTLHPLSEDGPYYAMILAPGALDTNGGPETNGNAQVLNSNGEPIPGLYGAGNCISSPSRNAYYGAGATLGPGMTYGYIAARHALGLTKENA